MSGRVHIEPLEHPDLERVLAMLRRGGSTEAEAFRCLYGHEWFKAIRSRDPYGQRPDGSPDHRWHVSVSRIGQPNRVPHWDALVAIVHEVRPGVPFVVGIPPEGQWMNVHPGVLHAVEVKDANLTAQWQHEATGQRPT